MRTLYQAADVEPSRTCAGERCIGAASPPLNPPPDPPTLVRVRDIALPDDGFGDVPMTADLAYSNNSSAFRGDEPLPVALVVPGFAGNKELFSLLSAQLAGKGYAVLVVGNATMVNSVRAQVVQVTLDWAAVAQGTGDVPALDLERVFIVGHSAGGAQALDAIRGVVSPIPSLRAARAAGGIDEVARTAPLRPLPEVRGLFLYAFTLWNRFNEPAGWREGVNNTGVPALVAVGTNDRIVANLTGTFDRLEAPKVALGLTELDHFSIADATIVLRPADTPSVVPRGAQVAAVAALADAWFRVLDATVEGGGGGEAVAAARTLLSSKEASAFVRDFVDLGTVRADIGELNVQPLLPGGLRAAAVV